MKFLNSSSMPTPSYVQVREKVMYLYLHTPLMHQIKEFHLIKFIQKVHLLSSKLINDSLNKNIKVL